MQSPVPVSNLQQTLANQLGNAYISLAVRGCMTQASQLILQQLLVPNNLTTKKGIFIIVTGGYHKCLIRVSSN